MNLLSMIARQIAGMFVDDEFLAITILALVATIALMMWFNVPSLAAGTLLLVGCIVIVLISVLSASGQ